MSDDAIGAEANFINPVGDEVGDHVTKKDEEQYADRWVGDVVIGSTGNTLCIRPSEAKKAMGLLKGETVRVVIWRAPAKNKLPDRSEKHDLYIESGDNTHTE